MSIELWKQSLALLTLGSNHLVLSHLLKHFIIILSRKICFSFCRHKVLFVYVNSIQVFLSHHSNHFPFISLLPWCLSPMPYDSRKHHFMISIHGNQWRYFEGIHINITPFPLSYAPVCCAAQGSPPRCVIWRCRWTWSPIRCCTSWPPSVLTSPVSSLTSPPPCSSTTSTTCKWGSSPTVIILSHRTLAFIFFFRGDYIRFLLFFPFYRRSRPGCVRCASVYRRWSSWKASCARFTTSSMASKCCISWVRSRRGVARSDWDERTRTAYCFLGLEYDGGVQREEKNKGSWVCSKKGDRGAWCGWTLRKEWCRQA